MIVLIIVIIVIQEIIVVMIVLNAGTSDLPAIGPFVFLLQNLARRPVIDHLDLAAIRHDGLNLGLRRALVDLDELKAHILVALNYGVLERACIRGSGPEGECGCNGECGFDIHGRVLLFVHGFAQVVNAPNAAA